MFRSILASLFVVSVCLPAWSLPPDEVVEALMHAEALYYEADFTKSIELLKPADELLREQPERLQERISVKLQLALAYIGLNDTAPAKANFRALYALKPDHLLDAQQFSPKVIQLAEEARKEQIEIECTIVWTDAQRQLGIGNAQMVVQSIDRNKAKCPVLSAIAPDAAELLFKNALETYRKGQLADALQNFRAAMKLDPDHELAAHYVELTESKLQVDADRRLLTWRKDFGAGAYVLAAADYRQLVASNGPDRAASLSEVRDEYRKALAGLVESSNKACAKGDAATVSSIQRQISEMIPDPSLGEGIIDQLVPCTKRECIQMESPLALTRLKTRVDPEIPSAIQSLLRQTPVTITVQIKIDEKGNVVSTEAQGSNSALSHSVRSAVERWKFAPTLDAGGPRCVVTEIPIVISLSDPNATRR